MLSGLSITFVAYTYQQNAFPIFQNLKVKTNENYNKMARGGLLMTSVIYVAVAIIGILMFGDQI